MGIDIYFFNFSKAADSVNETTPVGATDGIKGVAAKPNSREASTGSVNQDQHLGQESEYRGSLTPHLFSTARERGLVC